MARRLALVLMCAVAALLLAAPLAHAVSIEVTGIHPNVAGRGATVCCCVRGSFLHPLSSSTRPPSFTLTRGATTIAGTTLWMNQHTGDRAYVRLRIPSAAPAGFYDLNARQVQGSSVCTATVASAFYVPQPPVVTSLNPSKVVAGSGDLTLTVYGSGFVKEASPPWRQSMVVFDGATVATVVNAATVLTARVPAAALSTPRTVKVKVANPDPIVGCVVSDPCSFTVAAPVPSVSGISPTSAWAGYVKDDFLLTVTGANFVSGARVVLNGGDKSATAFVSATQLTVPLVSADLAAAGTLMVSVKNPPFPPGTSSAGAVPLALQAETTDPVVGIGGADSAWHNDPVALTFTASDSQSGVQKVQYMAPPGVAAWTDGASYTVPTSTQGAVTVSVRALDCCNRVGTASVTVNIDVTDPGTVTLGRVSVAKGDTARLRYRVIEPAGLSPRADVVLKIKRSDGTNARTFRIDDVPVNTDRTLNFRCDLARGTYAWYVHATDLAGNQQQNVARATLRVK